MLGINNGQFYNQNIYQELTSMLSSTQQAPLDFNSVFTELLQSFLGADQNGLGQNFDNSYNTGLGQNYNNSFSDLFSNLLNTNSINNVNNVNNINNVNNVNNVTTSSSDSVSSSDESLQQLINDRNTILNQLNCKTYTVNEIKAHGMSGMMCAMTTKYAYDGQASNLTGKELTDLNDAFDAGVSSSSSSSSSSSTPSITDAIKAKDANLNIVDPTASKTGDTTTTAKDVKAIDQNDPTAKAIQDQTNKISNMMTNNDNTKLDAVDIGTVASKLKTDGFKDVQTATDGKSLTFTDQAGETVTIHDANGDGSLNKVDYNFNGALSTYQSDLQDQSNQLSDIDAKIEVKEKEQQQKIQQMQQTQMLMGMMNGGYNGYGYGGGYGSGGYGGYGGNYGYGGGYGYGSGGYGYGGYQPMPMAPVPMYY